MPIIVISSFFYRKKIKQFHIFTDDRVSHDHVDIQSCNPQIEAEDSSSLFNFLDPPLVNLDTERSSSNTRDLTHSCRSSSSSVMLDTAQYPNQVVMDGQRSSNESDSDYLQLKYTPLSGLNHADNSLTNTELLAKADLQHDILTETEQEYSSATKDVEHFSDIPTASYSNVPDDSGFTSVSKRSPSQMHKAVENSSEDIDSGFSGEQKYPLPQ